MIRITAQNTPKLPTWHLNRRWSLADMDLIERMAERRATAGEIAQRLGVSRDDVLSVCQRNGIRLWCRS